MTPTLATASRPDERDDFIPLALHELAVERLEVEPKERLGVRGADVEVPVVRGHLEAVDVRDVALTAETLLDLLELERDVGDGRIQLAGQEVALAERAEKLGQRAPALRDDLQHEERRDRPGVGLAEVAKV